MTLTIDDVMNQFKLPDLRGALADFFRHGSKFLPFLVAVEQLMRTIKYHLITYRSGQNFGCKTMHITLHPIFSQLKL